MTATCLIGNSYNRATYSNNTYPPYEQHNFNHDPFYSNNRNYNDQHWYPPSNNNNYSMDYPPPHSSYDAAYYNQIDHHHQRHSYDNYNSASNVLSRTTSGSGVQHALPAPGYSAFDSNKNYYPPNTRHITTDHHRNNHDLSTRYNDNYYYLPSNIASSICNSTYNHHINYWVYSEYIIRSFILWTITCSITHLCT